MGNQDIHEKRCHEPISKPATEKQSSTIERQQYKPWNKNSKTTNETKMKFKQNQGEIEQRHETNKPMPP